VFNTFKAQSRNVLTFEEFLDRARTAGISDPGAAMLTVLRNNPVPGIDLGRIERDLSLNPSGNPGNVLRFLCHVAEAGQWGVNMNVTVR
jgi:hypothetical protein